MKHWNFKKNVLATSLAPSSLKGVLIAAGLVFIPTLIPVQAASYVIQGSGGGGGGGDNATVDSSGTGGSGAFVKIDSVQSTANDGVRDDNGGNDGISINTSSGGVNFAMGGGGGGGAFYGGVGKAGIDSQITANSGWAVDDLVVKSGNAGGGGGSPTGGFGGLPDLAGPSIPAPTGGHGGNGGAVYLNVAGTLAATGNVSISSGLTGLYPAYDGRGGYIETHIDTLKAAGSAPQTFTFAREGGFFNAEIGTLDVSNDVTVVAKALQNANANTRLHFGDIILRDGKGLTFDSNVANGLSFDSLSIEGTGTSFTAANSNSGLSLTNKTLNYTLTKNSIANSVLLNVNQATDVDMAGVNLKVKQVGELSLSKNDVITLMHVNGAELTNASNLAGQTFTTSKGNLFQLMLPDDSTLQAILLRMFEAERLKALAEARIAAQTRLNVAGDMISNMGLSSYLNPYQAGKIAPFLIVSGGSSEYETGSHVDVDGYSVLAGIGTKTSLDSLSVAAFIEAGDGSYDSYNSFSNSADIKGNGDTDYVGGGFLVRYDFPNQIYIDTSARAGRVKTNFNSTQIIEGENSNYDSTSTYYGAHAKLGYDWLVNKESLVNLYTKVLWTRQNSDSVIVNDYRVNLDTADSVRAALGGRLTYTVNEQFKPYIGTAWEYEFDGKQRISVDGENLNNPDLKGGTLMGELGFVFKPSDNSPFSAQLGIQGYTGTRDGVNGNLLVKYVF